MRQPSHSAPMPSMTTRSNHDALRLEAIERAAFAYLAALERLNASAPPAGEGLTQQGQQIETDLSALTS
jgi:hypothetical protein